MRKVGTAAECAHKRLALRAMGPLRADDVPEEIPLVPGGGRDIMETAEHEKPDLPGGPALA